MYFPLFPDSVLWEYIQTLHTIVHGLETRVQKTQDNVEHMRNTLAPWSRIPVFTRKDGLRDTLLNLEDRKENVEQR